MRILEGFVVLIPSAIGAVIRAHDNGLKLKQISEGVWQVDKGPSSTIYSYLAESRTVLRLSVVGRTALLGKI